MELVQVDDKSLIPKTFDNQKLKYFLLLFAKSKKTTPYIKNVHFYITLIILNYLLLCDLHKCFVKVKTSFKRGSHFILSK